MKHSMMRSSRSSYGMALSDRENQASEEVSSVSLRADSDNCGDNLNYKHSQQERTSSSSLSSSTVQNETRSSVQVTTIALFGAHGKTGNYFLKFALDAGYHVRALVPADSSSERAKKQHSSKANNSSSTLKSTSTTSTSSALQEFDDKTALTKVSGELDDSKAIKRVLKGADYVVCLLTDTLPSSKHEYPKDCLAGFLRRLYPLMQREKSIQVFLYQATSLAPDIKGSMPIMSKVLKKVAQLQQSPFLKDQDNALQHMAIAHGLRKPKLSSNVKGESSKSGKAQSTDPSEKELQPMESPPHFDFIITRPTILLRDGPSTRNLSASRSQPGPFPIAHSGLAEFSLNSLRNNKLFNTCPYVVADSF